MKPIMLVCAMLAFAVALPSEVLAQTCGTLAEAEALRDEAEAAKTQAQSAEQEGNVSAAQAAVETAREAAARAEAIFDCASDARYGGGTDSVASADYNAIYSAFDDARGDVERAERAVERIIARAEGEGAPERAREAAERAIADYRVIERKAVLAERAARAAQRALAEAEGDDDDDYMEAWERAQSTSARAQAVMEILRQAERLTKGAVDAAERSAESYAEAEDRKSRGLGRDDYFYSVAGSAARRAGENANEVANLRAQLEG